MGSPTCSRLSRFLPLALLCLGLAACGGAQGADTQEQTQDPPPFQGGGDPGVLPPPDPEMSVWDPDAFPHSHVALFGSFPSDLVRHGETLFAVDADEITASGALIRAIDVSGSSPAASLAFATTAIRDSDLRDSAGNTADATNPIGFGYFLNDVLIVNDTLGFALANAGGSDSTPSLSNVVAFDPTTGLVRQTFNLANLFTTATPLSDSSGGAIPAGGGFLQAGAEGMAFVPTSYTTGYLYVAMSNLIFAAPSYGATKNPGTLQVLRVDTTLAAPLAADLVPGFATRAILTGGYNPVAISTFLADPAPGGIPETRILVTLAGTTGYDASFNLVPVTPARAEAYDGATGAPLGHVDIGLAGLGGGRPALGRDEAGHEVGFFASSVTGEIYLARLDGFFRQTVDTGRLAVLRGPGNGIPITAAQSGGPGGNVTGVALSPDGRHLVACGFGDLFAAPQVPGQLFLLSLPADLLTGSGFGTSFIPGSTLFGTTPGRTLGQVVLVPGDGVRPEVYVNVSGTLDANYLGATAASVGSLRTFGLIK